MVRAAIVYLQQGPAHSSTTSCHILVTTLFGWATCHPNLLFFSSLSEVMSVQLAQVFSVELRAQPVIWQLGSPLACVCGWSSWRQVPSALLLSCSAEQQLWQVSTVDPSAMRLQDWASLQLSLAWEQWGRNREESRRRILPFPSFPLEKISPEITSVSCLGNTDFKAGKSNKTWMCPGQCLH